MQRTEIVKILKFFYHNRIFYGWRILSLIIIIWLVFYLFYNNSTQDSSGNCGAGDKTRLKSNLSNGLRWLSIKFKVNVAGTAGRDPRVSTLWNVSILAVAAISRIRGDTRSEYANIFLLLRFPRNRYLYLCAVFTVLSMRISFLMFGHFHRRFPSDRRSALYLAKIIESCSTSEMINKKIVSYDVCN